MKCKITTDGSYPYEIESFTINGQDADIEDFCIYTVNNDNNQVSLEELYVTDDVLDKYDINVKEYLEVVNTITDVLSIEPDEEPTYETTI
jgi:hypothetical protein